MTQNIVDKIKESLGDMIVEIKMPAERRVFLTVFVDNLLNTIKILGNDFGFRHLSTITGIDTTKNFEILYHFAISQVSLTIRVIISRENPEIPSICGLIPGAVLYEREIQDLLGITVKNIPDPRPIVLPDDWPSGNYPLRKDWNYEPPEEKIPGEKK